MLLLLLLWVPPSQQAWGHAASQGSSPGGEGGAAREPAPPADFVGWRLGTDRGTTPRGRSPLAPPGPPTGPTLTGPGWCQPRSPAHAPVTYAPPQAGPPWGLAGCTALTHARPRLQLAHQDVGQLGGGCRHPHTYRGASDTAGAIGYRMDNRQTDPTRGMRPRDSRCRLHQLSLLGCVAASGRRPGGQAGMAQSRLPLTPPS